MLGLLDRATQLASINGKEEHPGDRSVQREPEAAMAGCEPAFLLGLREVLWAAMSAVIVSQGH